MTIRSNRAVGPFLAHELPRSCEAVAVGTSALSVAWPRARGVGYSCREGGVAAWMLSLQGIKMFGITGCIWYEEGVEGDANVLDTIKSSKSSRCLADYIRLH